MVAADLVKDSIEQLAEVFVRFDALIGCAGMVAGRETPMKLASAALKSGLKRYFPWQSPMVHPFLYKLGATCGLPKMNAV